MADLNPLGVRLAVDDFGTGNASLRHLARFPVDVLKIDRSFVSNIGVDRRQTAIAGSIIGLGADLDMLVVAEGIETPEQLAELRRLGCDFGQGFYLGRPVPAAELERLLDPEARPRLHQQRAGAPAAHEPMIMQVAVPWASSLPASASISFACAVA